MATGVQTHAYTEAAGKTEHLPSSLSPSFSLSWAVQFLLLTLRLSCSLYFFLSLSLSHKLHNVPLSSCSGLLLCSMQTSRSEPTGDIIPLSLRCHLHHGAWSPGREGRESRGRRRRGRTRKAVDEGGRGIFGRDGGCVVFLYEAEATVCSDTRQIRIFLKSDLKDGWSALLLVTRLDVWLQTSPAYMHGLLW